MNGLFLAIDRLGTLAYAKVLIRDRPAGSGG